MNLPAQARTGTAGRGKGILLVIAAAVLWSTSGLFAKAPAFDALDTESRVAVMVFWRALLAAVVTAVLVRRPAWTWRMLPMMACFAAMNWAFLQALVATESTTAIWLQYTAPVYVLLGGLVLFGEKTGRGDLRFVALSLAGLAIILAGQVSHASPRGLACGILAGVLYAGVILSLRGLRDYDSAWLVFLNLTATAIAFLPVCFTLGRIPQTSQWWYLAGFGVLQLGLPYVLFARGLRYITSHEASLIVLLEPILVPVWVYLFWRNTTGYEPPAATTIAGGVIILASLAWRYGTAARGVRQTGPPQPSGEG